ncbi:hypothetical protein BH11MYX1_BH11MYX1_21130 [soil metagenome]
MDANTARTLLLGEHDAIRDRLRDCLALARRWYAKHCEQIELEIALDQLRSAIYKHNLSESALLRVLLVDTKTWGEQLIGAMIDEHLAEHVAMWSVLDQPVLALSSQLDDLAERLDAHMGSEERTFLAPHVLRTDIITSHRH